MNGWLVIALLAGVPTLTALLVYAAERDLRRLDERARRARAWHEARSEERSA